MTIHLPRCGRASLELREAFLDALEYSDNQEELIVYLWKCTDLLPGKTSAALGLPCGSTFGEAARMLQR